MTRKTGKIVGGVVGAATLGLIAYELWALANKDDEDTLSETYWKGVAANPALNFAAGYLAGHLTWQSDRVIEHFREEGKKKK